MATRRAPRGRPLDPAVGEAALRVTLELLDEHGYAGLRVGDVAQRAGIGLGALYRRWATKSDLVLAALAAAADERHVPASDDPMADLLDGLTAIATSLTGRGGRLLAVLFANTEPDLAAAVRTAKLAAMRTANKERLWRVIGSAPDLAARADLGPGLILIRFLIDGKPMTRRQIREQVLPLMIGVR